MEEIAQALTNYGFSAVLLAWMLFKDYKFNDNILNVLSEVRDVLSELKTWHAAEDEKR